MEHTAGITDMSGKEFSFKEPLSLPEAFKINPESRRLKWPPGFYHSYSNSGSGIAAYVIEQSSGRQFESFVAAEVFKPLGLSSATYFPTAEVRASLVTGYDKDGITPIPYWHTLYRAFAGINIRSIEMIRFVRMYLNQGKIDAKQVFSPAMIRRMETPTTTLAAKSGLEYGYGLGLYHFNYKGFPFIGHGGDADGYLSFLAYSRNLDLGYFVSFNAYNNAAMRSIRHIIQDHLIKGKTKPTKPQPWTLNDDRLKQIQGTYQAITHRFGQGPSKRLLEVFIHGNALFTRHGGLKRKLIPVNALHFRRINEPVATIAIINKSGSTYFQGDVGNFVKR